MYVARILYPVRVLGPGDRLGIWFRGCPRRCRGCSNPELWEQAPESLTTLGDVLGLIDRIGVINRIDGFTLSGGDPFYQPEALEELLPALNRISGDILVYTGYLYEELKDRYPGLLEQISVLVDGEYIEERNNGSVLKGSDNQRIFYLKPGFRAAYEDYQKGKTSMVQSFETRGGIITAGIHKPGYKNEFYKRLSEKGFLAEPGEKE
ncbi:MAG: radical SAM protein [Abditibacteriota bacterium]|nr:radical SAM protein [Abditibacteriota bacterium]